MNLGPAKLLRFVERMYSPVESTSVGLYVPGAGMSKTDVFKSLNRLLLDGDQAEALEPLHIQNVNTLRERYTYGNLEI